MSTNKKEIITQEQIVHDIRHGIKKAPKMSKAAYKRWALISAIAAIVWVVITLIHPTLALGILLALLAISLVGGIAEFLWRRHKIKQICIDDYEMVTANLSDTVEEIYKDRSYQAVGGWWRSETISNYTLRFENGKSWRIPPDNYTWSKECPMSHFFICQNSHRGDKFLLVLKKDTGEIVMAYHTDFFAYKKA